MREWACKRPTTISSCGFGMKVEHGKCSYGSKSRDAAAQSGKKWFPYNKGGEFKKWYGNQDYLVNWEE